MRRDGRPRLRRVRERAARADSGHNLRRLDAELPDSLFEELKHVARTVLLAIEAFQLVMQDAPFADDGQRGIMTDISADHVGAHHATPDSRSRYRARALV